MRTYLCTVGTSALRGPDDHNHVPAQPKSEQSAAFDDLWARMAALQHTNERHLRAQLPAEVHSLVRLGVTAEDRVRLFCSDTSDGILCARVVTQYLKRRMDIPDTEFFRVKGLQVDNAACFRRQGMVQLVRLLTDEGNKVAWQNVILNFTGGYKALAPIMTLVAMLFRSELAYMFDNGCELIRIPPLPIEFDEARLAPLRNALEQLERDSGMPEADFWDNTPFEVRQSFDVLIEDAEHGQVMLSDIGLLILERLRQRDRIAPLTVYLSLKAWEDFRKAPPEWKVADFLYRLRTPEDIERYAHRLSDGTLWLKPGNTTDRYRVEREGSRLLVYRIVAHDEYERLSGRTISRSQYAPFTRFDFVE